MMSPTGKSGRIRWPVLASRTWTALSYAPNASQVLPSFSHTAGSPVQPVPHHCLLTPSTDELPHIGWSVGNVQRIFGCFGTGPSP